MNWGIFTLLGVIVSVLGGVASFFVYLARKSAATAALKAVTVASSALAEEEPDPEHANADAEPERELVGALD